MKIKASLLAGLIASAPFALAQVEVATDPVGYVSVDLVAAGDSIISVPVHRAPEFQGIPESTTATSITFAAGTALELTESAYFVAVRGGTLAGTRATVVGTEDGGNTLVLEDGTDVSGLATGAGGDSVQLIPHWTLSTLFPEELPTGTQVLVFDRAASAINKSSVNEFEWFDAGGEIGTVWVDRDQQLSDDVVIHQGESIVVRSDDGTSFTLAMAGSVPMVPHSDFLLTSAADQDQDQHFGLMLPVDINVADLQDAGFPASPGDQILVFDNSVSAINKSSVEEYQAFDDGEGGIIWADRNQQLPGEDDVLSAGTGYVFRKAATDAPDEVVWTYSPSYLQE